MSSFKAYIRYICIGVGLLALQLQRFCCTQLVASSMCSLKSLLYRSATPPNPLGFCIVIILLLGARMIGNSSYFNTISKPIVSQQKLCPLEKLCLVWEIDNSILILSVFSFGPMVRNSPYFAEEYRYFRSVIFHSF